jgi:hypothetical protein
MSTITTVINSSVKVHSYGDYYIYEINGTKIYIHFHKNIPSEWGLNETKYDDMSTGNN